MEIAKKTGAVLEETNNPAQAVEEASIIYTDVFVSMGEEEQTDKMASFKGFQVNMELLENADEDWSFMHCLPAHRGEEVTNEVIDHDQSLVLDQAENRMWAQMSLLTYLCNRAAWDTLAEFLDLF